MMNLFLQLRYNQTPVDEEGGSGSSGERCRNGNAYQDVDDASKRERDGFDGKGEDGDVVLGGGKLGKSINEGYDRTKGDTVSTNMEPTKFQPGSASKFGTFTEKEDRGAQTVDKTGQQERKSTMRQGTATPTYFCTRTGVRFGRDIGKQQPESPSRSRMRNSTSTSPISQGIKQELKVATPGTTKRKRAATKEEEKPQSSRTIKRVSSTNSITIASNSGVPKPQPSSSNNTIISNPHQQPRKPNQDHHKTTTNKSSILPTTNTTKTPNLHPAERRILEHAADILSEKSGSHVTLDQLLSITQQTFFTSPNNNALPSNSNSNLEEVRRPVLGDGLVGSDSIVVVRDRNRDMYPSPPSSHQDFLVEGREEGMEEGGGVRAEGVKRVKKVKRRKTAGDCSIGAMLMG